MSYLWLLCSPGSCGAGGAHDRQADHRLCDGDLWHVLDSVADIGRLVAGQGEFLGGSLVFAGLTTLGKVAVTPMWFFFA